MGSIKFWKILTFLSLTLTLILLILLWRAHTQAPTPAPLTPPPAAITKKSAEKPQVNAQPKPAPKLSIAPGPAASQQPPPPPPPKTAPTALHSDFQAITVKSGDSLAGLFTRMNLSYSDLMHIMKLPNMKRFSNKLRAGQIIFFKTDAKKRVIAIKMPLDLASDRLIERKGNRFLEKIVKKPMTTSLLMRSGNVKGSFSRSAENSGLNSTLTHQFKHIFHGEINFAKDVHAHDHFDVLYKEYYVNGHPYHNGDIVAAKFISHHKAHYAFLFDAKGYHSYFDENGHALKARFMMPPVADAHITDSFTYHRLDPVLHVVRPHLGIDYAASKGSPVKSISDGQIIFSGKEHGYGNTVIVQYGPTYKALYGHLMHPAKGIHRGCFVKQGQTIGYLGSTGWSTGPHVHFELYVNGKPTNPLTLHAVSTQSVPSRYLASFKRHARQLIAKMKPHEHRA